MRPTVDATRLGDCPRCGRPVIEGKRGFGCSGWREGCPFVLWREYKGHTLGDDQVRELLQHRVLRRPVTIAGTGEVILQLADSGVLMEIPVPAGRPWRRACPEGGRAGGLRPAASRIEGADEPPRGPRPGRR